MKGRGEDRPLPHGDDYLLAVGEFQLGEPFYLGAGSGNGRGTNKDGMNRLSAKAGYIQVGLKTVDLAAKIIAVDRHIQTTQQGLAALFLTLRPLGQQDHPGTGAPGGPL